MLELERARPDWQGAALDGTLVLPGGRREPVTVLLGPPSTSADGLMRARRAASLALTLRHPGLVRLVQVVGHDDRVAWCYEMADGLGLSNAVSVGEDGGLSARAAAEIVAQVAEVLLAVGGPGLHHPGPEPVDLLVEADGHVRLTGFAGPYPPDPAMRPPNADAIEPGAVYRLGVLLATLLGGAPPAPAGDATAHEVVVRRALIRAMSRPGPVLSDRYGQWIRHMLAWAPAERPPLSAVPAGLRAVGWATGGEGLTEWAQRSVPRLQRELFARARHLESMPRRDDSSESEGLRSLAEDGPPPRRRQDSPISGMVDDDVTQEATMANDRPSDTPPSVRPRGSGILPVDIGPPAEALNRAPPTLPASFLTVPEDSETGVAAAGEPELGERTPVVLWGVAIALLMLLGGLFMLYLAFGDGPQATTSGIDAPSLGNALSPEQVENPAALSVDGPAPDQFAHQSDDSDSDTDSDSDFDTDSGSEPNEAASSNGTPKAPPTRSGGVTPTSRSGRAAQDGDVSVLIRMAPGLNGKLAVDCQSGARGGRRSQLRLSVPPNDSCEVSTVSPSGEKLYAFIVVRDFMTVDCFHDWQSDCLD